MVERVFERVLNFRRVQTPKGPVWLPLITVELLYSEEKRLRIPMLFDTGASTTVLECGFATLLGAESWTDGEPENVATPGGTCMAYRFTAQLEVLGKILECPVNLMDFDFPGCAGLLGREAIFEHFGFGFWESDHQLLITTNP